MYAPSRAGSTSPSPSDTSGGWTGRFGSGRSVVWWVLGHRVALTPWPPLPRAGEGERICRFGGEGQAPGTPTRPAAGGVAFSGRRGEGRDPPGGRPTCD